MSCSFQASSILTPSAMLLSLSICQWSPIRLSSVLICMCSFSCITWLVNHMHEAAFPVVCLQLLNIALLLQFERDRHSGRETGAFWVPAFFCPASESVLMCQCVSWGSCFCVIAYVCRCVCFLCILVPWCMHPLSVCVCASVYLCVSISWRQCLPLLSQVLRS